MLNLRRIDFWYISPEAAGKPDVMYLSGCLAGGRIQRDPQSTGSTCLVSGCIIMHKSDILKSCFAAATFVVVLKFSQNNVFIELACDRSAFWHRDLNSWTLISEKIAYKTFFTVHICLALLGRAFLVAHIRLAAFRFGSK